MTPESMVRALVFFLFLQYRKECCLWKFNVTDHLHALFTFFLFFKKLAFTCNISTVTFCKNVFTHWVYSFACNDLATDGSLNCNFKLLAADFTFETVSDFVSLSRSVFFVTELA